MRESRHLLVIFVGFVILLILSTALLLKDNYIFIFIGIVFIIVLVFFGVILYRFLSSKVLDSAKDSQNSQNLQQQNLTQSILPMHSNVGFSDVAGIKEAKEELLEIVDFLKKPAKYKKLGITLPKGVLLSGAPGVGKTLIAKALAGESGVPFFYQSGASFVEMYVGVGAKRVRELFNIAKINAPSIIFIDEIDAIGKKRILDSNNNERESTLNQLLTEMDGFNDNSGVIVIGATNRIESLDSALLRSGRFDRKIFVELPDINEREEILKIYLHNKPNALNIHNIAQKTSGFSGAMLATLVNEAALNALKLGSKSLKESDFEAVYSKISSGKRRLPLVDEKMKNVYALYQASKIYFAFKKGLKLDKSTLFETSLVESNFTFLSTRDILDRLGFYLVGNEMLKKHLNNSYGLFRDDFLRAEELLNFSLQSGVLEIQKEQIIQGVISEIRLFIDSANANVQSLAQILLLKERIENADIETLA